PRDKPVASRIAFCSGAAASVNLHGTSPRHQTANVYLACNHIRLAFLPFLPSIVQITELLE
ncbi:MAG: hypothetical protein ACREEM_40530, partial [Blastocatellia bacterium]